MALNLLAFAILLDALGAEGFGQMTLGLAVAYIVSVLAGLGLDVALFRGLSSDESAGIPGSHSSAPPFVQRRNPRHHRSAVALPLSSGLTLCIVLASLSILFGPLDPSQRSFEAG